MVLVFVETTDSVSNIFAEKLSTRIQHWCESIGAIEVLPQLTGPRRMWPWPKGSAHRTSTENLFMLRDLEIFRTTNEWALAWILRRRSTENQSRDPCHPSCCAPCGTHSIFFSWCINEDNVNIIHSGSDDWRTLANLFLDENLR